MCLIVMNIMSQCKKIMVIKRPHFTMQNKTFFFLFWEKCDSDMFLTGFLRFTHTAQMIFLMHCFTYQGQLHRIFLRNREALWDTFWQSLLRSNLAAWILASVSAGSFSVNGSLPLSLNGVQHDKSFELHTRIAFKTNIITDTDSTQASESFWNVKTKLMRQNNCNDSYAPADIRLLTKLQVTQKALYSKIRHLKSTKSEQSPFNFKDRVAVDSTHMI